MKPERGNSVVLGPPGTGKTTKLAQFINLGAKKFGAERILVASLTKTAATELAQRGLPIPRQNVGTLHSICYRELDRPPLVYPTLAEFNAEHGMSLSDQTKEYDDIVANNKDDRIYARYDLFRSRMIGRQIC